jgi:ATP-binding cassette subfamily C protein LapB
MSTTIDIQALEQAAGLKVTPEPSLSHEALRKQQLLWSVQRLSQMQGGPLDPLRLKSSLEQLPEGMAPEPQLAALCRVLEKPAPKLLKKPDRVYAPMLACHPEAGWGVLIDRAPDGRWVMHTAQGPMPVSGDDLHRACMVVHLGPKVNLGFGLFIKPDESLTFFSHVRQTLMLYRRELVESCIASAFIGFLALATSMFSMQVYDRVIPTRSEYTLVILSVGVMLSILIELAMKFARSHVMDYVVVGLDNRLSREIFDRLLQLRVDQVPNSVGSLAAQMRGYEQVRGFYTATTLFTIIDLPLAVIFTLVIAVVASPWVALVPLVFGVVALFIGLSIRKKIMSLAKESATLSNLKTGLLVEAVEGIETIKAGSGGWKFLSRWVNVNAQTIQSDLKTRGATESVGYLSASVQQISYAGLVVVGSLVVMQGHMTMGALIASSILSGRILAPIMAIPGLLVQYSHAQAALEGLERLYTLKTDHHDVDAPLTPDVIQGHYVLSDIRFAYGDNPPALVMPRLEIRAGERIAVLGPIGAGKSSLLRLLSGLYLPQDGKVLLDGLELAHISRQVVNQKVGYLQQDHRLFHGSLRDNLLIGLPDPGDEALLQAMRRTGMDAFVASHPKGLARVITEGGKGLSGGQKQLVAFTRLVLCQPNVYLLDEPTATMDDEQERRCLQVLAQEAQTGKTMVIVTHKPTVLPLVTRIMVVVGNKVVIDGPRDTVLQQLQQGQAAASSAATSAASSAATAASSAPNAAPQGSAQPAEPTTAPV